MLLGSRDGIVWLGHKATSNLVVCSCNSTAGVSDDRLRMEGLFGAPGPGRPNVRLVTGGQGLGQCEMWEIAPVGLQLSSFPDMGTWCFGFVPFWEMGLCFPLISLKESLLKVKLSQEMVRFLRARASLQCTCE